MRRGAGMWFEQNDEEKCNYLKATGLFRTHYFYLDKEPWIADRIFIRHNLRVHFSKSLIRRGFRYTLAHIWVWKKNERVIDQCMRELYRDSLLMGRDDYPEACDVTRELNRRVMDQ